MLEMFSRFTLVTSWWLLVVGQSPMSGPQPNKATSDQLTRHILEKLLSPVDNRHGVEEELFSGRHHAHTLEQIPPIRRYLDEAKQHLDIIDFTGGNHVPRDARDTARIADDLRFHVSGKSPNSASSREHSSASEQVPVTLALPGDAFSRREKPPPTGCGDGCADGVKSSSRWAMPLQRLGGKQYYLGTFFKANWYKAEQYCRFHGMHLASINSAEEQKDLQEHIQSYGMGHEHFWTSGTDQGEEGKFFWMSTGRPVTFENWNAGEPNNFEYEDGEQEHCLEMWDRDGKGLKWNDTPCSFSTFFVCET